MTMNRSSIRLLIRPTVLSVAALLCIVIASLPSAILADSHEAVSEYVPTVLITGSNRGIGLEFARQYAARGWNVIATCRTPARAEALAALDDQYPRLSIAQLDVTDHAEIDALAEKYADTPIDVLLNNAGINPSSNDQVLGNIDYDLFRAILETNTIGPMKMSEAFMDNVRASERKTIVALSSGMGSIENAPRFRGVVGPYRVSKAGVNMAMRVVYSSIGRRGVLVAALDPGLVDTDQAKNVPLDKLPPAVSVAGMIDVIDTLNADNSGTFIRYDGERVPW